MWFGPKMGISALKGVQKNCLCQGLLTVSISLKGEMIGKLTLITTEIISEAAALDYIENFLLNWCLN